MSINFKCLKHPKNISGWHKGINNFKLKFSKCPKNADPILSDRVCKQTKEKFWKIIGGINQMIFKNPI